MDLQSAPPTGSALPVRLPVAAVLGRLAVDLDEPAERPHADALHDVVRHLRDAVPGTLTASIAWRRAQDEPVVTAAATDARAADADHCQAHLGEGPTLHALGGELVSATGSELAHRWPAAAPALAERFGFTAVLALPLPGLTGRAALNLYGDAPFPPEAAEPAIDAAAVAAVAVAALQTRERANNLDIALTSSRQIAAAVGIVMAEQRCSYDEAFTRIRGISQRTHRKMRDLADEILLTGDLPAEGACGPSAG